MSGDNSDLLQRVTRLEANLEHMSSQSDVMAAQLKEVHDLLLQAKGAKWAIIGMATLGGFVSAKLGALATSFGFNFLGK